MENDPNATTEIKVIPASSHDANFVDNDLGSISKVSILPKPDPEVNCSTEVRLNSDDLKDSQSDLQVVSNTVYLSQSDLPSSSCSLKQEDEVIETRSSSLEPSNQPEMHGNIFSNHKQNGSENAPKQDEIIKEGFISAKETYDLDPPVLVKCQESSQLREEVFTDQRQSDTRENKCFRCLLCSEEFPKDVSAEYMMNHMKEHGIVELSNSKPAKPTNDHDNIPSCRTSLMYGCVSQLSDQPIIEKNQHSSGRSLANGNEICGPNQLDLKMVCESDVTITAADTVQPVHLKSAASQLDTERPSCVSLVEDSREPDHRTPCSRIKSVEEWLVQIDVGYSPDTDIRALATLLVVNSDKASSLKPQKVKRSGRLRKKINSGKLEHITSPLASDKVTEIPNDLSDGQPDNAPTDPSQKTKQPIERPTKKTFKGRSRKRHLLCPVDKQLSNKSDKEISFMTAERPIHFEVNVSKEDIRLPCEDDGVSSLLSKSGNTTSQAGPSEDTSDHSKVNVIPTGHNEVGRISLSAMSNQTVDIGLSSNTAVNKSVEIHPISDNYIKSARDSMLKSGKNVLPLKKRPRGRPKKKRRLPKCSNKFASTTATAIIIASEKSVHSGTVDNYLGICDTVDGPRYDDDDDVGFAENIGLVPPDEEVRHSGVDSFTADTSDATCNQNSDCEVSVLPADHHEKEDTTCNSMSKLEPNTSSLSPLETNDTGEIDTCTPNVIYELKHSTNFMSKSKKRKVPKIKRPRGRPKKKKGIYYGNHKAKANNCDTQLTGDVEEISQDSDEAPKERPKRKCVSTSVNYSRKKKSLKIDTDAVWKPTTQKTLDNKIADKYIMRLAKTSRDPKGTTVCEICYKEVTKYHIKSHVQRVHIGLRPHQCELCDKSYFKITDLKDHMNYHTKKNSYSCSQCPAVFLLKKYLTDHKRNHKVYRCPTCSYTCSNYLQYSRHMHKHYEGKVYGPCEACGATFKCQSSLYNHIKHHHPENPAFKCTVCGEMFPSSESCREHKTQKHLQCASRCFHCGVKLRKTLGQSNTTCSQCKNELFRVTGVSCDACGDTFVYSWRLTDHIHQKHPGEPAYKCIMCGEMFSSNEACRKHKVQQHLKCADCGVQLKKGQNNTKCSQCTKDPHLKTVDPAYKCDMCGEMFSSMEACKKHKSEHKTNIECDQCGNVYVSEKPEETKCGQCGRESKHGKMVTVKCHLCDKVFNCSKGTHHSSCQYQLTRHIRSVHSKVKVEKKMLCEICSYQCIKQSKLQEHMYRKHTTIKQFKCECGKAFAIKYDLKRHKIWHTGEKPYKCELCDKAYTTTSQLRLHSAYKHKPTKYKKCNYCGDKFQRHDQLYRHMITHKGTKRVRCSTCGAVLQNTVSLAKHRRMHVEQGLFKCKECGKALSSSSGLKNHFLKMHPKTYQSSGEISETRTDDQEGTSAEKIASVDIQDNQDTTSENGNLPAGKDDFIKKLNLSVSLKEKN